MSTPKTTEDEVLSGEAVAIDVQPVGFFFRAMGAVIDIVVSGILLVAFLLLALWMTERGLLDEAIERILTVVALVVCLVVIPIAIEVSLRGRSLGKLAIGGRIVRLDGGAIGFRHSFIRALLGVLEIYLSLGSIAIISGALTARSQRLGDLVAGTYSQRVRTPRLLNHEPLMPPQLAEWAAIADVARMPDRLARRVSQFLQTAQRMAPDARERVAGHLLGEAAPFISPMPAAPPEHVLAAVTVIRRGRELQGLRIADERAELLTARRIGV